MAAGETRDHDRLDFPHVYGEFHAKVHRYLDRLVGPTDAGDVTQETFAKVTASPRTRHTTGCAPARRTAPTTYLSTNIPPSMTRDLAPIRDSLGEK
jgi:DNA-directed RNA polymerase specialized sigma24 family protein